MMEYGYITYYWQTSNKQTLQDVLFQQRTDDQDNLELIPIIPNLGICEGNGMYGSNGVFYTCARSQIIMETPSGCQLADPFIVTNLLGVWA